MIIFFIFTPKWLQRTSAGFEPDQLQIQAKACTTTSLNHVWKKVLVIDFNNYFLYFYPKMIAKGLSRIWAWPIANSGQSMYHCITQSCLKQDVNYWL